MKSSQDLQSPASFDSNGGEKMNKKIGYIGMIVVMFAVIALSGCVEDDEIILFESYTEMHSVNKVVFGDYWTGQTFIVNEAHYIAQVNLYISKVGMPNGNIIVSIRETIEKDTGYYVPFGDDLISNMTLCNSLPDVSLRWVEFTFEDTELEVGKYAIVIRAPDANATAHPRLKRVQNIGNYSDGTVVSSSDAGVRWSFISGDDYLFEEYGKRI